MQRRCLRALYDAGEGMTGEELVKLITVTGNETRAWGVLLDLVEAGRVERVGGLAAGYFTLSSAERDAVLFEIFVESGDPGEEHDGDS
jgi:hypothetical protein